MYSAEKIEKFNRARLALVCPELAARCERVIERARGEGFTLLVTQGLRTFAEQEALYRKRPRVTNARGGQSFHNYGLAADFAFVTRGEISWETGLYKNIERWARLENLEWGGAWKTPDLPHVQLTGGLAWRDCLRLAPNGANLAALWKMIVIRNW